MAIGKKIIEWGEKEMQAGMTTGFDSTDGGFVTTTDAVNLISVPGAAYPPAAPTDCSNSMTGSMLASCADPISSYNRLYVANNGTNGLFYVTDGTNLPTQVGTTDSTHQYISGKTDMGTLDDEVYITSNSTIVRWSSVGSSNTFDTAFFSFASTGAPHPVLAYNNYLYFGDGNLLLIKALAGTSAPTTVLTLPAAWQIVTLGIDPGSGNMLISVINHLNLSDTLNPIASVIFYNGASNSFQRSVQVDEMVTAFYSVGGDLFVTYGQNFGAWTGTGIRFLRHLNIGFDKDQLAYKGHITSVDSTVYIIEGRKILAYGPIVQNGPRRFYYAFRNYVNTSSLTNIAYIGSNIIGMGFPTSKFYTWDTRSVATSNTYQIDSPQYFFPDQYMVTRAVVIFRDTYANATSPGTMDIFNENNASIYPLGNQPSFTNTTGAATTVCVINNIMAKVYLLQFRLALSSVSVFPGIRKVIFYGYPVNLPLSGQSS